MIRLEKVKRHGICNSCGCQEIEKLVEIQVSPIGEGWTVVVLCNRCLDELIMKIGGEEYGKNGPEAHA